MSESSGATSARDAVVLLCCLLAGRAGLLGQPPAVASSPPRHSADPDAAVGVCAGAVLHHDAVNKLNPAWAFGTAETHRSPDAAKLACEWVFLVFEDVHAEAEIRRMAAYPNYKGWWLLINEPDLDWDGPCDEKTKKGCLYPRTAEDGVDLLRRQMKAIRSVDPQAKFCVGLGSQVHAPGTAQPWFPPVWEKLTPEERKQITGFHVHYYPQMDTQQPFDLAPTVNFLKRARTWMASVGAGDRQLWLTEIGINRAGAGAKDENGLERWLRGLHDTLPEHVDRWAWFATCFHETGNSYVPLVDAASGRLTPLGEAFARLRRSAK